MRKTWTDGVEIVDLIPVDRYTLKLLVQKYGCHRDTIYSRFGDHIKEARAKANRVGKALQNRSFALQPHLSKGFSLIPKSFQTVKK